MTRSPLFYALNDFIDRSIPVFAAILLIYLVTLRRLRLRLDRERPIDEIVQLDHLTDMWTTLFFGTGVIWTAIGMRSALIFALSDPEATIQHTEIG